MKQECQLLTLPPQSYVDAIKNEIDPDLARWEDEGGMYA